MEKNFEDKYHDLEQHYWWHRARREFMVKTAKGLGISQSARILDIGCAGGNQLDAFRAAGYTNLTGIDNSKQAVEIVMGKGIAAYKMDGLDPDLPEESADSIFALDIIEHLEDDVMALKNWKRILKKDGRLILMDHRLNNLTAIVDYNKIQSLAPVSETLGLEPFADKWTAFGWNVVEVDGHDHAALRSALARGDDGNRRA